MLGACHAPHVRLYVAARFGAIGCMPPLTNGEILMVTKGVP